MVPSLACVAAVDLGHELTLTPTLTPTLTLIQSISGMSFLIASGLVLMAGITGVVYIRTQVCARHHRG